MNKQICTSCLLVQTSFGCLLSSLSSQRKGLLNLYLIKTDNNNCWSSLVVQLVKSPPAMQETWVWSLGREDLLEKEKATHSSILENSMVCIVHGVTKSWTHLSDFHFWNSCYCRRDQEDDIICLLTLKLWLCKIVLRLHTWHPVWESFPYHSVFYLTSSRAENTFADSLTSDYLSVNLDRIHITAALNLCH